MTYIFSLVLITETNQPLCPSPTVWANHVFTPAGPLLAPHFSNEILLLPNKSESEMIFISNTNITKLERHYRNACIFKQPKGFGGF